LHLFCYRCHDWGSGSLMQGFEVPAKSNLCVAYMYKVMLLACYKHMHIHWQWEVRLYYSTAVANILLEIISVVPTSSNWHPGHHCTYLLPPCLRCWQRCRSWMWTASTAAIAFWSRSTCSRRQVRRQAGRVKIPHMPGCTPAHHTVIAVTSAAGRRCQLLLMKVSP